MRYNLRGLQAFGSVARHRSLVRAAAELGITESAVSHQLRRLAEEMGERLVYRSGRSIALTETGQLLAERINAAFSQIEASVAQAVGSGRQSIRLAGYTGFLVGWLIPRLDSFRAANPDIDLNLVMASQSPELTNRVADAFITSGPSERGFWSMRVAQETLVPIYAPSAAAGNGVMGRLPLITTEMDPEIFVTDWTEFARVSRTPLEELHTGRWLQCSHYILAIEMARRGQGIALVPDFLAADDLRRGTLARLGNHRVATGQDYHFRIKTSRRNEPAMRGLVSWLRTEIEKDGQTDT